MFVRLSAETTSAKPIDGRPVRWHAVCAVGGVNVQFVGTVGSPSGTAHTQLTYGAPGPSFAISPSEVSVPAIVLAGCSTICGATPEPLRGTCTLTVTGR